MRRNMHQQRLYLERHALALLMRREGKTLKEIGIAVGRSDDPNSPIKPAQAAQVAHRGWIIEKTSGMVARESYSYPIKNWKDDVNADKTRKSYWDWVYDHRN